ncbi:MAG TPA: hypothetical protein VJ808_11240, partial [Gemmatimonadales bacterium]|nr:hypothetical protein [Gemmatimonadales bacterium]
MTTENFAFPLRLARLRAPLVAALFLTLASCHSADPLSEPTGVDDRPMPGETEPQLAVAWAGGIPFGLFALPTSHLGSIHNGVVRNARVWVGAGGAANFKNQLAAIKSKNGKVFLQLTGSSRHY